MGAEGLRRLGWDEIAVTDALDDIRRRDVQRLTEQVQGDFMSGRDKMLSAPEPEPLGPPKPRKRQIPDEKMNLG